MEEFIFDVQRFDDEDTTDTTDETTEETDDTEDTETSGDVTITEGGTYTLASDFAGTVTIGTTAPVILVGTEGSTLTGAQIVTGSAAADLTLNNINLTSSTGSPIKFGSGGGTLTLLGTNTLATGDTNTAALNIGGGLTIKGTGSLTAASPGYGAAIGTDYGETTSANLTVTSGTINASSNYGAGLGSGFKSSVGTITITGGTVNASATSGAGVGTGAGTGELTNAGTIAITGGVVSGSSRDGAGIGSGFDGAIGNISIGGTANVNGTSTGYGAGIGSGSTFGNKALAGNISIDGKANILATSAMNGAGIGTGYAQYNGTNSAGTISISGDATVTAASLNNGIGIGAGTADSNATNSVGAITLNGDASTVATSTVVIDNSDTTRQTTINGVSLAGDRLIFVDGTHTNPTVNTTPAVNVNEIVFGENVTGITGVGKVDDSDDYIYIGGLGVISDYAGVTFEESGESGGKIRYAADFYGFNFDGTNLVLNSSTGSLIIQDCKDKVISIADFEGNTTAYVYSPTAGGVTYGNLFTPLEVIAGSDNGSDFIFAGNGGSTLWGGFGAFDDTLVGGAGHDEFIYLDGGGNDVIANYGSEDVIKINGVVNGVNLFGNFALNFSNGSLTLADYQDRIITVADGAGNILGQACYASSAGVLDGRGLAGTEILVGGAFGSNLIIAGNSGSSLWANFGGVNTLIGGAGSDEFIYTAGSGLVFAQNANAFDTINLLGMTFDQIAAVAITPTETTLAFTDGGALNVQGSGAIYKINGANYIANAQTGTLTQV